MTPRDPRLMPGWLADEVRRASREVMTIRAIPLATRKRLRDAGLSYYRAAHILQQGDDHG